MTVCRIQEFPLSLLMENEGTMSVLLESSLIFFIHSDDKIIMQFSDSFLL